MKMIDKLVETLHEGGVHGAHWVMAEAVDAEDGLKEDLKAAEDKVASIEAEIKQEIAPVEQEAKHIEEAIVAPFGGA
jgi:hypothetical protein